MNIQKNLKNNDEDKENKNPNLIHIEENTLSEEQNSSIFTYKNKI